MLTDIERSSLYYISGYVTREEGLHDSNIEFGNIPASEFTKFLSGGKLSHPPAKLYDLSQYFFCFFKMKILSVVILYYCKLSKSYMKSLDTILKASVALYVDMLIVFSKLLQKMKATN